jgi:hypothetical protein
MARAALVSPDATAVDGGVVFTDEQDTAAMTMTAMLEANDNFLKGNF